jgi:hypothetical protein
MKNYALQFWLLALAGWINREQQDASAYLREVLGVNHSVPALVETSVLQSQIGMRTNAKREIIVC